MKTMTEDERKRIYPRTLLEWWETRKARYLDGASSFNDAIRRADKGWTDYKARMSRCDPTADGMCLGVSGDLAD